VLRMVHFEVQLLPVAFRCLCYLKTIKNEGHVELRKLVLHCGVISANYIVVNTTVALFLAVAKSDFAMSFMNGFFELLHDSEADISKCFRKIQSLVSLNDYCSVCRCLQASFY